MQKVIPMKSFIEIMNKKPNSKAEILFYKLLPKWKNHKSWDFIKADIYPKPEIKPGENVNDTV